MTTPIASVRTAIKRRLATVISAHTAFTTPVITGGPVPDVRAYQPRPEEWTSTERVGIGVTLTPPTSTAPAGIRAAPAPLDDTWLVDIWVTVETPGLTAEQAEQRGAALTDVIVDIVETSPTLGKTPGDTDLVPLQWVTVARVDGPNLQPTPGAWRVWCLVRLSVRCRFNR